MQATLPVKELLDALAREEQTLKKLGAFAQADGVRTAINRMLKMADELTKDGLSFNSERR